MRISAIVPPRASVDVANRMISENRLNPVVYEQTYTLDTLVQGLDDLEKRRTWGKAIARVRSDSHVKTKL